jgi:hypothetical protein
MQTCQHWVAHRVLSRAVETACTTPGPRVQTVRLESAVCEGQTVVHEEIGEDVSRGEP